MNAVPDQLAYVQRIFFLEDLRFRKIEYLIAELSKTVYRYYDFFNYRPECVVQGGIILEKLCKSQDHRSIVPHLMIDDG